MILARIKAKASTHFYYLRRGAHLSPGPILSSIYQAVSGDIVYIIQDRYRPQDFDPEENICFEVASSRSARGSRINDKLGYSWLTTVFYHETKAKGRSKRQARKQHSANGTFEIPQRVTTGYIIRAPIIP
jgi:hypothetical protein